MKKKLLFGFLILLTAGIAKAQNVKAVSFERLQQRFQSGKDTTYVLNFWATWCAPCIKEMPHFEALQSKYKSSPVKVIFLSLDFKSRLESGVKPLVKRLNLKNEVYLVDKKSEQEFIDQISKDWEGAIPGTLFLNQKKGLWKFYQKEFTYPELEETFLSLK